MLILLRPDASTADRERVVALIRSQGFESQLLPGSRPAVALLGGDGRADPARYAALPGVDEVIPLSRPWRMVAREWRPEATVVRIGGSVTIGSDAPPVIAGPCSVESEAQIFATARAVKAAGAAALRAGAFKPRTSPYAFQGLGVPGLELLAAVRRETGLPIVTEALDEAGLERVAELADVIQIGARNMQNFALLKLAGRSGRPVLLKRGMAASVADLLLSAEYVLAEGNPNVILCERGIRAGPGAARTVFDINAIPVLKHLSHLPVLADPSHATGRRALVPPAARAALAAGADGLLIEVHADPETALSDGAQSLYPEQFALLMEELRRIAAVTGRTLANAPA